MINHAERLKALRKRLRWTQQDLANALSVTIATISRWENGHCHPQRLALRVLDDLEDAYGLKRK